MMSPTSLPALSAECTQQPTSSRSGCSSTPLIAATPTPPVAHCTTRRPISPPAETRTRSTPVYTTFAGIAGDNWADESSIKIEFGVLGPLQMTVDGAPVALGTPKQRAVLAMLVMNRNRPVSTDSLITAAWEQWPPPEARASLHSYISNLRKLIGERRRRSEGGVGQRAAGIPAQRRRHRLRHRPIRRREGRGRARRRGRAASRRPAAT